MRSSSIVVVDLEPKTEAMRGEQEIRRIRRDKEILLNF